jgi:hypothetical protein
MFSDGQFINVQGEGPFTIIGNSIYDNVNGYIPEVFVAGTAVYGEVSSNSITVPNSASRPFVNVDGSTYNGMNVHDNACWDGSMNPKVCADNLFTVSSGSPYPALPSAGSYLPGQEVTVVDASTATPGTCVGGGSIWVKAITNGSTWTCQ